MTIADPDPHIPSGASPVIHDDRLKDLRAQFAPFFFSLIKWTFLLVAGSALGVIAIVFHYDGSAAEKALMAQTVQTGLGMLLGLVTIALGSVMIWVAIEAPFTLMAKSGAERPEVNFQSVSPGIALCVGGLLLIGFSLYLPMYYIKSEGGELERLDRQRQVMPQPP